MALLEGYLFDGDAGGGGVVGVAGVIGSEGRVPGEAEGEVVRSRSVPPTRSLLSVHPASTPAPSARTHRPVKNLFIVVPPSRIRFPLGRAARGVPPERGLRYAGRQAVGGEVVRTRRHTVKESSQ